MQSREQYTNLLLLETNKFSNDGITNNYVKKYEALKEKIIDYSNVVSLAYIKSLDSVEEDIKIKLLASDIKDSISTVNKFTTIVMTEEITPLLQSNEEGMEEKINNLLVESSITDKLFKAIIEEVNEKLTELNIIKTKEEEYGLLEKLIKEEELIQKKETTNPNITTNNQFDNQTNNEPDESNLSSLSERKKKKELFLEAIKSQIILLNEKLNNLKTKETDKPDIINNLQLLNSMNSYLTGDLDREQFLNLTDGKKRGLEFHQSSTLTTHENLYNEEGKKYITILMPALLNLNMENFVEEEKKQALEEKKQELLNKIQIETNKLEENLKNTQDTLFNKRVISTYKNKKHALEAATAYLNKPEYLVAFNYRLKDHGDNPLTTWETGRTKTLIEEVQNFMQEHFMEKQEEPSKKIPKKK